MPEDTITPTAGDPRLSELTTVAYVYATAPGALATYNAVIRRTDSSRVSALLDEVMAWPGREAADSTEEDPRASQIAKAVYVTTDARQRVRVRSFLVPYTTSRRVVDLLDELRVA